MKKDFSAHAKPVLTVTRGGEKKWLLNGLLHCDDGHAAELADGTKVWARYGKRQRADGPAVIGPDGSKHWYQNNKRHREDGPAVEWANGDKLWYLNGKLHREDGPAMMLAEGVNCWYLHDQEFETEEAFSASKLRMQSKKAARLERDVRDATILRAPMKVSSAIRLRR